LKCPLAEFYRKLPKGEGTPIVQDSGGVAFSQPKFINELKIKAICNLRQQDEVDKTAMADRVKWQ
jgi:hypothetical protein